MRLRYVVFLLSLFTCFVLYNRVESLKRERDKYELNTNALLSEIKRFQLDSSRLALEVNALKLSVREYKKYRKEDAELINELGIKVKNLEAAARHKLEVEVPIKTVVRDSVFIRDTVEVMVKRVRVENDFLKFDATIENSDFNGNLYLPVTLNQVVYLEYKRKFLFWKKVKGIKQVIVSDNPYVDVKYSELILFN